MIKSTPVCISVKEGVDMERIRNINLPKDARLIKGKGIDIGISTHDASWDPTPDGQEFLRLKRGVVRGGEVEKPSANS